MATARAQRRSDGHGPWGRNPPSDRDRASYADAATAAYWLDLGPAMTDAPPLDGETECDLAIVGAGLSGLWAAVQALERAPGRSVVVLDANRVGGAASGRNGGFVMSSLTHGIDNGLARFPDEMPQLERLGLENFDAITETVERYGIDCDLERTGVLDVAVEEHELAGLAEYARQLEGYGHEASALDREQVQAELHSPLYLGGIWQRSGAGLLDPLKLTVGLAETAARLGASIHEHSPVLSLRASGHEVDLVTSGGRVRARKVLLATSASTGLVSAIRRRVVAVWDYVLVTEPLSESRLDSIGWRNRQGVSDLANRFHYYRLTADGRILFGGYDAIYHYRGGAGNELAQRDESFAMLASHFFTAFPQLEGVRFSHRWGGAIDTCSRFFAFQGTALDGRVGYTVGHTGLGVGASRFGAAVALDMLDGVAGAATPLRAMWAKPLPFPPEPLRWAAIELTRNRLAAADRGGGERGLWLRTLDRLGLGFDS